MLALVNAYGITFFEKKVSLFLILRRRNINET